MASDIFFPVRVLKLKPDAILPTYAHDTDAAADIRAYLSDPWTIDPGEAVVIPTGLAFDIDPGFEVQVRPRSGLPIKSQLLVANSPGTIDSGYTGEVKVGIVNVGTEPRTIHHGDRIAQIVPARVLRTREATWPETDRIREKDRGDKGFGSTGS